MPHPGRRSVKAVLKLIHDHDHDHDHDRDVTVSDAGTGEILARHRIDPTRDYQPPLR